jgi:hypothetical protein
MRRLAALRVKGEPEPALAAARPGRVGALGVR